MFAKSNAEHPPVTESPKTTTTEPLIIEDKGGVSEKTRGCCGFNGELGTPPFNTHQ